MRRHTTTKRLPLVCFCIGVGVFAPILVGCSNGAGGNHQLTADDFKQKTPPPEALKAMQEAQKRAGRPANAQATPQGAPAPNAAPASSTGQ